MRIHVLLRAKGEQVQNLSLSFEITDSTLAVEEIRKKLTTGPEPPLQMVPPDHEMLLFSGGQLIGDDYQFNDGDFIYVTTIKKEAPHESENPYRISNSQNLFSPDFLNGIMGQGPGPSAQTTNAPQATTQQPIPPNPQPSNVNPSAQRPPLPSINDFPTDPENMANLLEMGFLPESRIKKALFLNKNDLDASAMWLIEHQDDPDVDADITEEQVAAMMAAVFSGLVPPGSQKPSEEILHAIQQNICTFSITGESFQVQEYYTCLTCSDASDNKGVCITCSKTCHQGHQLSDVRVGSFYCDCGSGDLGTGCTSLSTEAYNDMFDDDD